nr:ABC transporter substrate-binding protein [Pirellula sp.]
ASWPQSVSELADERWKNKCGMAYPIYGTTATHMTVMASHPQALGPDRSWEAWVQNVAENAVVLAGNKQVALAVSAGDLEWGLTDTDDAIIEKESGKPVAILFPDQSTDMFGTLFIPNTLAVVQRCPHPVAAASLADHLVSEKIESRLTMSSSAHFPIWPTASETSRISTENTRWAEVNFENAAKEWERVRETLLRVFGK